MKKYLLERGLRLSFDFTKAMGIEMPATSDAFFLKAQAFIQYEEKEAAHVTQNFRHEENTKSAR